MPLHFAQGAALGFSAAASPGPFQAYALSQAVRNGAARTLPLALAPLASDGPIVALALLALSRAPPAMLRALEGAGGLVLVALALGAARALRAPTPAGPGRDPPLRAVGRGVLVNLLNPSPWVFWTIAGGPILARSWAESPARAASFLAGFYLLLCGGTAALVGLFASARRLGPGAARALSAASALALAAIGVRQIWRAVAG